MLSVFVVLAKASTGLLENGRSSEPLEDQSAAFVLVKASTSGSGLSRTGLLENGRSSEPLEDGSAALVLAKASTELLEDGSAAAPLAKVSFSGTAVALLEAVCL